MLPQLRTALAQMDSSSNSYASSQLRKYFDMLTKGCGNTNCTNNNCASSGLSPELSVDEAALKSIDLLKARAQFCDMLKNTYEVIIKKDKPVDHSRKESRGMYAAANACEKLFVGHCSATICEDTTLNEANVTEMIDKCLESNDYALLRRTFGAVFSRVDLINSSFVRQKESKKDSFINVDCDSLRKTFTKLTSIPDSPFLPALNNALSYLFENVEIELRYNKSDFEATTNVHFLNMFVLAVEILSIFNEAPGIDDTFAKLCVAIARLPVKLQCELVKFWSRLNSIRFLELIRFVQQFITLKTLSTTFTRSYPIQQDLHIIAAICFLRLLYYSAIYGYCEKGAVMKNAVSSGKTLAEELSSGSIENMNNLEYSSIGRHWKNVKTSKFFNGPGSARSDILAKNLGICVLDCCKPAVPLEEFYNETISDAVELDVDLSRFFKVKENVRVDDFCGKLFFFYFCSGFFNFLILQDEDILHLVETNAFSFMIFPFVLIPECKMRSLFYFNRINMQNESRRAFANFFSGVLTSPYLHLKIRRTDIVHDALAHLEIVASEEPDDLKKQMFVEFEHEQAVDEGGVSKEFYQLITAQLFNLDYGMFIFNEATHLFWFNSFCVDCSSEYTLIGMLFGLAIYNYIIVDVQLPIVLYKKLMNTPGSFDDLKYFDPVWKLEKFYVLYSSLQAMLECDKEDFESVFGSCTFTIAQTDPFDSVLTHNLVCDGDKKFVNKENCKEFVNHYADFLLNKSIEAQYSAFKKGFMMVVNDSPLFWLFRPEELDQIVCGSKDLDFAKLETFAEYDNDYSPEHPTIKNFWQVVHEMSEEQKRNLLKFVTGSDRIPIGGMSKLRFIVAKNGPDSEQLPTAQTCFNVLLLPNYSSKEKLRDRLLKAVIHCKGFGIL
uniref:HECT-type E3 ubiquitin transferase n=1 Tax=Romanomermis culicivorax TaxID=13658 RepID=A0A915J683_ROMCU